MLHQRLCELSIYCMMKKNTLLKLLQQQAEKKFLFHVLLPANTKAKSVMSDNKNIAFKQSTIEQSNYADFESDADGVKTFNIQYCNREKIYSLI